MCEIHGTVLARLPEVGYMQKREFTLRLKMPGSEPEQLLFSAVALEPSDLQKYCDRRVLGGEITDTWLENFQVQEVSYLASTVGSIILGHDKEPKSVQDMRDADQVGFELLFEGRERFRDFIGDTMDRARQRRQRTTLLGALGPIGKRLSHFGKDTECNQAANTVHQIIQETRPVGTENVFFGKPFVRMKHSIQSASHEYGLPFSVLRTALEEEGLLVSGSSREVASTTFFDKTAMAQAASRLLSTDTVTSPAVLRYRSSRLGNRIVRRGTMEGDYVSTLDVGVRLRVPSHVVSALADDGYLSVYRPVPTRRVDYDRDDVYRFINLYISETRIREYLSQRGETFEGYLDRTKLQPAIPKNEVGEDFYLRSEYKLTI